MKNNIGTSIKRKQISEDLTYYYEGYLINHEPTALDFSRWFIGRK